VLIPANGVKIVPLGVGYLRAHAPTLRCFHDVLTYFSPEIKSTSLSTRSFLECDGNRREHTGTSLHIFEDKQRFSLVVHHRVIVPGCISCGKLFSFPLVPSLVSVDDPMSAPHHCVGHYSKIDASFDGDVKREVDHRVFKLQQQMYATLDKELERMPEVFSHLPYHEFFQEKTDVNSTKADAERLLWHQRLGHPSDYYLYHACIQACGWRTSVCSHGSYIRCLSNVYPSGAEEGAGWTELDNEGYATFPVAVSGFLIFWYSVEEKNIVGFWE
jgi:hypothetical protein